MAIVKSRNAFDAMISLAGLPATGGAGASAEETTLANGCGCSVPELRQVAGASLAYLIAGMKSGNINQGYAQCMVDQLVIQVAEGKCAAERIQCRVPFTMRALAVGVNNSVTFSLKPVGPSVLRELLLTRNIDTAGGQDQEFFVTGLTALGRPALTGTVTTSGTAADQPAMAIPLEMFAANFQNYVAPSGVAFDSSQTMDLTILNLGTVAGNLTIGGTYDVIRAS